MFRMIRTVVVLLVATLAWPLLAAGQDAPLPNPSVLKERVLARAKEIEKSGVQELYEYRRTSVRREMKEDGTVKSLEETQYQMVPRDGLPYPRLLSKNGATPSAKDIEDEEKRYQRARKRLEERRRTGKTTSEDRVLSREILDRFDFIIEEREALNGRSAIRVALKPKAGLKDRTQTDKVLNRLAGHVWVDEADYELVRADMQLTEPVSFYAILGVARKLRAVYEAQMVDAGVWFPARFELEIDARRLVSNIRTKQTEQYFEYRRHEPPAARRGRQASLTP
jgi:hypothetical protein